MHGGDRLGQSARRCRPRRDKKGKRTGMALLFLVCGAVRFLVSEALLLAAGLPPSGSRLLVTCAPVPLRFRAISARTSAMTFSCFWRFARTCIAATRATAFLTTLRGSCGAWQLSHTCWPFCARRYAARSIFESTRSASCLCNRCMSTNLAPCWHTPSTVVCLLVCASMPQPQTLSALRAPHPPQRFVPSHVMQMRKYVRCGRVLVYQEILLLLPRVACHALPWLPQVRMTLDAFLANTCSLTPFPLPRRESCSRLCSLHSLHGLSSRYFARNEAQSIFSPCHCRSSNSRPNLAPF